jgi:hypothetical protein
MNANFKSNGYKKMLTQKNLQLDINYNWLTKGCFVDLVHNQGQNLSRLHNLNAAASTQSILKM